MFEDWLLPNASKDKQSITSDWEFVNIDLIEGVEVKEVKNVLKNNGSLVEVVRTEWLGDNDRLDQIFQVTLLPGAISAWHAHETTRDRLFVNSGVMRIVLFDFRKGSPSYGRINEFRIGIGRPALITVPPKVWHGIQNISSDCSSLLNIVDAAYSYGDPDHWRVEIDCPDIPYKFQQILV